MTGNLIATTPKSSMNALAFKGIMVYGSFAQIRNMLQGKFGDEYVLLFARPEENAASDEIDWYTPVQGQAQRLENAEPEIREQACAKAASMARDIDAFADELIKSPDPLKVTRGNILKLALCYPNDNCLYIVGEQPVFICWGFAPGTPGVEPKSLLKLVPPKKSAAPAAPMPAPQPEPVKNPVPPVAEAAATQKRFTWGWLWWLLPLLAGLLFILLLFTSFGHIGPLAGKTLIEGPELPFMAKTEDKLSELNALEKELALLHRQVKEHAALCRPDEPAIAMREQTPPPATPDNQLVIPENAGDDMSFLNGKWLCRTGLANARTGEPVEVWFTFDEHGQGTIVTIEKNDQCTGSARAQMHNGELVIQAEEQKCQHNDGGYNAVTIDCKNAEGNQTECLGTYAQGNKWNANFQKIQ